MSLLTARRIPASNNEFKNIAHGIYITYLYNTPEYQKERQKKERKNKNVF